MKATILRGISGSGKSTFAKEYIVNNPNITVEINRDNARRFLFSVDEKINLWTVYKMNNGNEFEVSEYISDIVQKASFKKLNIIDSDTNLNPKYLTRKIEFYRSLGYKTEIIDIECDLYECIDRDAKRTDSVGAKVIFKQYLKLKESERNKDRNNAWDDFEKRNCVVADLDGTLALNIHRDIYDYTKVVTDEVREEIACMVKSVAERFDADIIFCSGREQKGDCYHDTSYWLVEHAGFRNGFWLNMREEGDQRKDSIIKSEFLNKIRETYNIVAWFDDRPQVCDMLNDEGVNVICVADQRLRF